MQTEHSPSQTKFAGTLLEDLETLHDRVGKLRGEAGKKASQHVNELTDWFERLEFQTRIAGTDSEQKASGAQRLLKKAWDALEKSIKQAALDVQRQLEDTVETRH